MLCCFYCHLIIFSRSEDRTGVKKFNTAKAEMESASAALVVELMKDRQTFIFDGEF